MQLAVILVLMISLIVNVRPALSSAAKEGWNEVAIRMGIQAGSRHEYFHQYDAYAVYGLPWEWRMSSGWGLTPQLSTSAGVLRSNHEVAFIGSVGTGVTVNKPGIPVTLDLGINADLLDRRQIAKMDFGSILQFGAYIGFSYYFDFGLGIGYRLQHLSNGHIFYPSDTANPGLDMHLIAVDWCF